MIADDVLPWLGYVFRSGPLYSALLKISSVLHAAAGVMHAALALYDPIGWLAQGVVDAAANGLSMALSGVPGVIGDIAFKLGLSAILHAGAAVGHGLIGMGLYQFANWSYQSSMDIADWCSVYGRGKCAPRPPSR